MKEYILFSRNRFYCKEHHKSFLERCPICFTSNSQVITSNSQGARLTRKYVKVVKDSVWERFHSYGVKFNAVVQWDNIFVDPVRLNNNVEYKRLDFPSAIVKVFKRSILVTLRSSSEVKGLLVRDAELVSKRLIVEVLHSLPKSVVVQDSDLVSVHNAFVNHPTAKYGVSVSVDGEKRLLSDNSKGRLEFEAVNPVHAISDSEKLELMNKDLITSIWDLPSVTKSKLDSIIDIQADYAENIKKHLLVQDETLNTLKLMQSHFLQTNSVSPPRHDAFVMSGDVVEGLPLLPSTISKSDMDSHSKSYRLMRARQLLREFGWGDSVW